MNNKKPTALIILDGWGYKKSTNDNAIAKAHTPHWDHWWATRPHQLLEASGQFVGLPEDQMGNSDVGHKHIGAGRVMYEDFTRINQAIENGEFFHNPVFSQLITKLKNSNKTLHVMGLLSPGGVHSHEEHLFAFLKLCQAHHLKNLCLHLFLDGRDTPPQSALKSIAALNQALADYRGPRICSLSGRYYAMDRDLRWERTNLVHRLMTEGESPYHFDSAEEAIKAFYQKNISDEFIPPCLIGTKQTVADGDAIFFFNFRADRARQLSQAFLDAKTPKLSQFVSMTRFGKHLNTICAYPPLQFKNTLGEVIAAANLRQLRLAETEKYAHVTYFFNGGSEEVFPNEDRILIPSPQVATYDLAPEMSAPLISKAMIEAINQDSYDVIICNFANADMVGHTGNFEATVKAIECLDHCLYDIWQALEAKGGQLLITADHGNAETMFNTSDNQAHTAHTIEPVPLLYLGAKNRHFTKQAGSLIDVAPTLLALLGLKAPVEMTGTNLLVDDHA